MRNSTRHVIEPYEDLITTVIQRILRWFVHIARSTGLAEMILSGTVQGGEGKADRKKRWEDNISEWAGLGLG